MKKNKVIMLFVLVFIMLSATITACNTQLTTPPPSSSSSTSSEESSSANPPARDPYVVKIIMCDDAESEAVEAVAAAASKITKEKFNTTIELVRYGFSSFNDQRNLMLSSGEKLDLMPSLGLTVPNAANNGMVHPLNDLLEQYGKDMLEQIPQEDWECTSLNGIIYAVRNNKELGAGYGYAIPTEYVEALNMDLTKIKTDDDYETVLRKAKEKFPDLYPLVSDRGTMGWYIAYMDDLGGDFGVLEDCTTNNTTVVNWYSTDTYKDIVMCRYRWAQEGLLLPNGSTNSEGATDLIKANKAFSCITKPYTK
jgi:putative aldouronate transport system substrate-binding protein